MNFGTLNGGGKSDNHFADLISPIRADAGSTHSDFTSLMWLVALGMMVALSFAFFMAPWPRGSASVFTATYQNVELVAK